MSIILKGKPVADYITQNIKTEAEQLTLKGVPPKLITIRVGERHEDIAYEQSAVKRMEKCGIIADVCALDANCSTEDLLRLLRRKNEDNTVHGILIFQPLPRHIDTAVIRNEISRIKDVDCIIRRAARKCIWTIKTRIFRQRPEPLWKF